MDRSFFPRSPEQPDRLGAYKDLKNQKSTQFLIDSNCEFGSHVDLEIDQKDRQKTEVLRQQKRAAEESSRREQQKRAAEESSRREQQKRAAEESSRREQQKRAAEESSRREQQKRAAEEQKRAAERREFYYRTFYWLRAILFVKCVHLSRA